MVQPEASFIIVTSRQYAIARHMAHTFNFNTREAVDGGPQLEATLYSGFQTSQGQIVRPCSRKAK